jgi:hypothetical protein
VRLKRFKAISSLRHIRYLTLVASVEGMTDTPGATPPRCRLTGNTPIGEIFIFPNGASAAGHDGYIVVGSETSLYPER